jgi:hypothetical protein
MSASGRNESLTLLPTVEARPKHPKKLRIHSRHINTPIGLSWGGGRSEIKEETAAGRRGT